MTRRQRAVQRALEVLAAEWFEECELRRVPAHVEWRAELGGPVDTFRVYAAAGDKDVLLAQVPRSSIEVGS